MITFIAVLNVGIASTLVAIPLTRPQQSPSERTPRAVLPLSEGALSLDVDDQGRLGLYELAAPARPERLLWRGPQPAIDWYGRSSALELPAGDHVVAVEQHGGGARQVRLWRCATRSEGASRATAAQTTLLNSVLFEHRRADGSTSVLEGFDVASPFVFEVRGEAFLAGSARTSVDPALRVFVAPVDELLAGRPVVSHVVYGIEPRVVQIGDELVLAARWPENAQEQMGQSPLTIHRSRDGKTWVQDELAPAAQPRGTALFELGQMNGQPLVVSLSQDGTEIELSRFDTTSAAWQVFERRAAPTNVDREAPNLLFLRPSAGQQLPTVLLRERGNQLPQAR